MKWAEGKCEGEISFYRLDISHLCAAKSQYAYMVNLSNMNELIHILVPDSIWKKKMDIVPAFKC